MNYEIAIPSFQRQQCLVNKTLAYLKLTDINLRRITVFVADKNELLNYRACLPKDIKTIIGKPTLKAQRKFIRYYYPKGTQIFNLDDDIRGIFKAISPKKLELVKNLHALILEGFSLSQKFNCTLWGMNAVCNPYFMHNKPVSFNLKYIVGAAYGEVINPDTYYDTELEDKEDFERTILHFRKTGRVLRFNDVSFETNYYKEPGGMQVTRTKERVTTSAHYLLSKYPRYCSLNTGKKNQEFTEIKLNNHAH